MISIDLQKCNGCGICVDICPTGAITIQDNIAVVEHLLCEDCQVCVGECPQGAILLEEQISVTEKQPVSAIPASKVEVLPSQSETKPISRPVLAAVGTAIVEVLPRLASLAVDWLEHRPRSVQTSNRDVNSISSANRNVSPRGIGRRSGRGQGRGRGQGQGRGRGQGKGRGQGQGRGRGQGKNRRQRGNRR